MVVVGQSPDASRSAIGVFGTAVVVVQAEHAFRTACSAAAAAFLELI